MIRSRSVAAAITLMLMLISGPALAEKEFNVQMFRPSPHSYDLWNTYTTTITPDMTFGGGLLLHYGRNPLVYSVKGPGVDDVQGVIRDQLGFDAFGSIALFDHLSIGLAVPVLLLNSGDSDDGGFIDVPDVDGAISGAAIGDIRLDIKGAFLRNDGNGFGVGLDLNVSFPTNAGTPYAGDDAFTIAPQLILDFHQKEFFVAFNGGARIRTDEGELSILTVGNELLLGLGGCVTVVDGLLIGGEVQSVANLTKPFDDENQTQVAARGGIRYRFESGVAIEVGGGGGFLDGYGNTSVSAFLGVRYLPPMGPKDSDLDGIIDDLDACPFDPEDYDGFQDQDGCPDPDNDQDGILDIRDQCPNDPEDFDNFEDVDGCPDPDNDKDGIPDIKDQCPNSPEDFDGFEDEDGCPDPDNDKDGIPDVRDQCPNDPETMNNFQDEDGCPDKEARAQIIGSKIAILDNVYFATNKDIILEKSFPILMEVSQVLKDNPDITKVMVEGHTDSRASDAFNLKLSDRRAKSVRKFLIEQGIDEKRLISKGFGEQNPVQTNDTEEGRAANRRVEFTILERATK